MNIFNKAKNFLKESWLEGKKINWPTRQETLRYTLIVIGVSVALAVFLGGADLIFTKLLNKAIVR